MKCNIPLTYNGNIVGAVFQYEIVGNDKNGLPIVCINGELVNREISKIFPEYRYTALLVNEITLIEVKQQ